MIAPKVSIKVHVVNLSFLGELIINSLSHLFIVDFSICSILLHPLDGLVELILEHLDRKEWIPQHKLSETGIVLSQLIHVYRQSVTLANYSSNLLLTVLVIQEVLHHLLHLELFSIGLH